MSLDVPENTPALYFLDHAHQWKRGERRMDELAKRIERTLKELGFCVVFEDELQCCWPSEKIKDPEREKQIHAFAKSHGWIVSILNTDSGVMRAIFSEGQLY